MSEYPTSHYQLEQHSNSSHLTIQTSVRLITCFRAAIRAISHSPKIIFHHRGLLNKEAAAAAALD